MPVAITATEARSHFGEVIRRVHKGGETLVVERSGLPVVVILPVQKYRVMRGREKRLVHFRRFSRRLGQAAAAQKLTEEQLLAELEEDRRAIYQETYGAQTAT